MRQPDEERHLRQAVRGISLMAGLAIATGAAAAVIVALVLTTVG